MDMIMIIINKKDQKDSLKLKNQIKITRKIYQRVSKLIVYELQLIIIFDE